MLAILKKELRSYFTGVVGYVFLVIYLLTAGLVFAYTTLYSMSGDVTRFYLVMLLFSAIMLPLLTMKSFSEERRSKTEQLILTSPVSLIGMVMGKFLASYIVFASVNLFTSLYFLLLIPYTQLKWMILIGNAAALLLVGFVFISIGLFVSALSENQLSAAIGTIAIILGFLAIGLLGSLVPAERKIRSVLDALSIFRRYQTFTSGYFDLSTLIYYLSVGGVFLWLTVRVFDRRRYD